MRFLKIFIVILLITGTINIIYLIYLDRKDPPCNCLVTAKNGEKIRAKRVNWYNSGFADIKKCNGENLILRSNTILKVESLKGIKK